MLHEVYTLAVKGASLSFKDRPHVEYSKSASYALRHKRNKRKQVMYFVNLAFDASKRDVGSIMQCKKI